MSTIKINYPLRGDLYVTQEFGANPKDYQPWFPGHEGRDYAVPVGTDVYSSGFGSVSKIALSDRFYGIYVVVDHGDYDTYYCHLSALRCALGDTVYSTSVIGLSGNTGRSSGPHLHHALRVGVGHKMYSAKWKGFVNPLPYYFETIIPAPPPPPTIFPTFPKPVRARYTRLGNLNVRRGPGTMYDLFPGTYISNGESFDVLEAQMTRNGEIWLRIGFGQWVAMGYNGQQLCEFIEG